MARPWLQKTDWFWLAGMLLGWGARAADDALFLCTFLGLAILAFIAGIWQRVDFPKSARVILTLLVFIASGWLGQVKWRSLYPHTITPGSAPNPLSQCPVTPGSIAVYAAGGADSTIAPSRGGELVPELDEIIVVGNLSEKMLSVSRGLDGNASISARIFDDRANLVAKLDHNEFTPSNFAAYERVAPDKHSRVIYDHLDREVLNVRFLNDQTVQIVAARFYTRDGKTLITLTDKGMRFDSPGLLNVSVSGGCMAATRIMFSLPEANIQYPDINPPHPSSFYIGEPKPAAKRPSLATPEPAPAARR